MAYQIPEYHGISVERLKEILNFECEELDRTMLMKDVTADEIEEVIFKMARTNHRALKP